MNPVDFQLGLLRLEILEMQRHRGRDLRKYLAARAIVNERKKAIRVILGGPIPAKPKEKKERIPKAPLSERDVAQLFRL